MERFKHLTGDEERCGFIMPDGSLVEVPNVATERQSSFRMEPADVISHEEKAWGTFHTHPNSTSNLSGEDYIAFTNYPDLKHIIIGDDGISCYSVAQSGVVVKDEAQDLPPWEAPQPGP